jgi:hypothetical protein
MSIKKLLGKVAVGAAVGALVIAGASMVMAQNDVHPGGNAGGSTAFTSAGLENSAVGLAHGNGILNMEYTVDQRAYLYAQQAEGVADSFGIGKLNRVDSVKSFASVAGGTVMGNVGRVWVETNYPAWDVVATLHNGGKLVRVLSEDEMIPNDTNICRPTGGPFSQNVCKDTIMYRSGAPLKYRKSAAPYDLDTCHLEVGVGIINWPAGNANATIANIEIDTILDFSAVPNGGDATWASFAIAIGKKTAGDGAYTNTDGDSLTAFATTPTNTNKVAGASRTLKIEENGFPLIIGGQKVDLAGNVFGEKTSGDGAMLFFINARIVEVTGATTHNTTAPLGTIAGNLNGTYRETIEFQFFGLY